MRTNSCDRRKSGIGIFIVLATMIFAMPIYAKEGIPDSTQRWNGNGHYYQVYEKSMTWKEAKAFK